MYENDKDNTKNRLKTIKKTMKNRVYYGEYTLACWIELMLTKKITLPEYQRYFVWDEDRTKRLIDSLRDNRFVPPVTIGAFKKDDEKHNYIIDGQQRLTSILLAYLGIFPDKDRFRDHLVTLANGNEQSLDEGEEKEEDQFDNVLEWNFGKLIEKGKTKAEILEHCDSNCYKRINDVPPLDFFKNAFLAFSYIVPATDTKKAQQKYYAKVFREINIQGVNLQEVESRRAMYFLIDGMDKLFEPEFAAKFCVNLIPKQQMDFSRYLCFLSAYNKHQNVNKVARGYRNHIEMYIESYIHSIVDEDVDEDLVALFGKFSDVFPNNDFTSDMERLTQTIKELQLPQSFPSIINMDTYFFGLIYYVLFKHRSIDIKRKDELKETIEKAIIVLRDTGNHAQAPAQLRHMRARISKSIEEYSHFLIHEE